MLLISSVSFHKGELSAIKRALVEGRECGHSSLILRLARNTVPTLSKSQFANGGIALLNLISAPSLFVAICLVE